MNFAHTVVLSLLLAVGGTGSAAAEQFTRGIVKKVDLRAKKVTIIHDELKSLDMPAMTMVFRIADEALLERLKEGEEIHFVAGRVNGKLTVTDLK